MASSQSTDQLNDNAENSSAFEPQETNHSEASTPEVTPKPRPTRRRPARRQSAQQSEETMAAPTVSEPASPAEPVNQASDASPVSAERTSEPTEAANNSADAPRTSRRRILRRRTVRPRPPKPDAADTNAPEAEVTVAGATEAVPAEPVAVEASGEQIATDETARVNRPSRNSRRRAKRKAARVSAATEAGETDTSETSADKTQEAPTNTVKVNLNPRSRNNRRRRGAQPNAEPSAVQPSAETPAIEGVIPSEPAAPLVIPGLDTVQPEPTNRSRRDRSRQRRSRSRSEAQPNVAAEQSTEPKEAVQQEAIAEAPKPVQRPNRSRSRKPSKPQSAAVTAAEPIVPVVEPEKPEPVTKSASKAVPVKRVRRPEPKIKIAVPKLTLPKREPIKMGMRRGHPEIVIKGTAVPPMFFFGYISGSASENRVIDQVGMAAEAGVHLHMMLVELVVDLQSVDTAVAEACRQIQLVTQRDPDGYVMLRLMFTPPRNWSEKFKDGVSLFADGTTGEPSFFSEEYWAEAEAVVTDLAQKMELHDEADRLLGYHLDCREWFHEYERGYDTCKAAIDSFRRWLRVKYKDDDVLLRAAWHNGVVDLDTASIPVLPKESAVVLFENHRERPWVDFLQFSSNIVAKRLISISRAAKKSGESRRLIAVPYGYTFEFPTPYSGHLDLAEVLSASSIDMVCAPPSYRDRLVGCGSSIPAPIDSVLLHEKLFIMEDDTKPHFAKRDTPDTYNPKQPDRESTTGARLRAIGSALARQMGITWMDLWGEGWLADSEHWKHASMAVSVYRKLMESRQMNSAPDVAFIVDENSITHMKNTEKLLTPMLLQQRDVMLKSGVNFGVYLQSDIVKKAFPEAKVYVFMNALQINSDVRAAITEKLQNDGKCLVWVYAAGIYDENGECKDGIREVTGLQLRPQPWNSESGSIIVNDRHAIAEHMKSKQFGVRERLNPSFYCNDQSGTIIAEYVQTGLPSVVCKDMGSWRSVFIGERQLSIDLLRNILKLVGVTIFQHGNDVLRVSQPFISLYATEEGHKTIVLPGRMMVYDMVEQRVLAGHTNSLKVALKKGQSAILAAGTLQELKALGLDIPDDQDETASADVSTQGDDHDSAALKRRRRGGRKHRKPHVHTGA